MYEVSLKYLLHLSSYRADTKYHCKLSMGNNSKNIKSRVLVLVHDKSSECTLLVYQNSYGNGKTEFKDFSRTFYIFQGLNFFQFCITLKNENKL